MTAESDHSNVVYLGGAAPRAGSGGGGDRVAGGAGDDTIGVSGNVLAFGGASGMRFLDAADSGLVLGGASGAAVPGGLGSVTLFGGLGGAALTAGPEAAQHGVDFGPAGFADVIGALPGANAAPDPSAPQAPGGAGASMVHLPDGTTVMMLDLSKLASSSLL